MNDKLLELELGFQVGASVILGLLLGPIFYFLSPEWSILLGGVVGGTIAYFIGELNVN